MPEFPWIRLLEIFARDTWIEVFNQRAVLTFRKAEKILKHENGIGMEFIFLPVGIYCTAV